MSKRARLNKLESKLTEFDYRNKLATKYEQWSRDERRKVGILKNELSGDAVDVLSDDIIEMLTNAAYGTGHAGYTGQIVDIRLTGEGYKECVGIKMANCDICYRGEFWGDSLANVNFKGIKYHVDKIAKRCTYDRTISGSKCGATVVNKLRPFLIWLGKTKIVDDQNAIIFCKKATLKLQIDPTKYYEIFL